MGNIIITFLRINDAQNIRNILVRNGWGNVSICTSGAGTLAMADQLESGVSICVTSAEDAPVITLFDAMRSI